jgi:hypothetical protein
MLHVGAVDGRHLTRQPKRKGARGVPKYQTSVIMPAEIGLALRDVARASDRSVSDIIADACAYWLDINHPEWRPAVAEAADGG